METGVYVDVLLVLNYVINMLLLACVAKLAGRCPPRRRMVAAALLGSVGSLTIFLPFMGFFPSVFGKLALSCAMVLLAFPLRGFRVFVKEWFLFFTVSFFFAGVMLGLWMALRPRGMLYYNGIVYFDISSLALIAATVAAYLLLGLFHRFSKAGRMEEYLCRVQIYRDGHIVELPGLLDTGNSIYEPFSGDPVIVCSLDDAAPLVGGNCVRRIKEGCFERGEDCGLPLRAVPFRVVGGTGIAPAFRPEAVVLVHGRERRRCERVFVALAPSKVGTGDYAAIVNPDIAGIKLESGGVAT